MTNATATDTSTATITPPAADSSAPGALTVSPEIIELAGKVEAMLISSGRAVAPVRLGVALGMIAEEQPQPAAASDGGEQPLVTIVDRPKRRGKKNPDDAMLRIETAVVWLNDQYAATGRSFRIERVSGGYRLMTLPQHHEAIARLLGLGAHTRLSKAGVETLAIIAYRQPITRGQLEAIRGVACGEVLKSLVDRRLITIAGRAEELGRPLLYATSKAFLEAFGLTSLKDLPTPGELGFKVEAKPEQPVTVAGAAQQQDVTDGASASQSIV